MYISAVKRGSVVPFEKLIGSAPFGHLPSSAQVCN